MQLQMQTHTQTAIRMGKKMAMQMQPREMWELFSAAGFGQKPQIDFPGTVTGRLKPYKNWRPVEQATMAYGYGLSASLLQMAQRGSPASCRQVPPIPCKCLKSGVQFYTK